MKRTVTFWIIAIIITVIIVIYQRVTGPTYPVSGKTTIDNKEINYKFSRSSDKDEIVSISTMDEDISGFLVWKRHKTHDRDSIVQMKFSNGNLSAVLPLQPPAGKLEYFVALQKNNQSVIIPDEKVIIRFKGHVPDIFLIPHIITIFIALLMAARTGLEYFNKSNPDYKKFSLITLIFMFAGGFVFGSPVQYYAFGTLWSGFPFGTDLTDNKTAIALVIWIAALVHSKRSKKPGLLILLISIFTLLIFLIPHSLFGSELKYHN